MSIELLKLSKEAFVGPPKPPGVKNQPPPYTTWQKLTGRFSNANFINAKPEFRMGGIHGLGNSRAAAPGSIDRAQVDGDNEYANPYRNSVVGPLAGLQTATAALKGFAPATAPAISAAGGALQYLGLIDAQNTRSKMLEPQRGPYTMPIMGRTQTEPNTHENFDPNYEWDYWGKNQPGQR